LVVSIHVKRLSLKSLARLVGLSVRSYLSRKLPRDQEADRPAAASDGERASAARVRPALRLSLIRNVPLKGFTARQSGGRFEFFLLFYRGRQPVLSWHLGRSRSAREAGIGAMPAIYQNLNRGRQTTRTQVI
jgi:hypothetical protein